MARILIVEDEGIIAENTGMFLKNMGHNVIAIVDNGESAIDIIDKGKPDLILMDIVLQGKLNGIDTTKIINERFGTPVIYVTAHYNKANLEEASKTKYCAYIHKPFNITEFKTAIEDALD